MHKVSASPTILVSLLPRGEPFGASALVALDRESQEPLAVHEFGADEYLEDPELGEPGQIRHCRGVAQAGDRLFVALFNCVREYRVKDIRQLLLEPGRLFTHPRAVDLHGICIQGGTLSAASTGSDSVISWDLDSGEIAVTALFNGGGEDVRFPDRLAREAGKSDWRQSLDAAQHVNGVSIAGGGTAVVCSLTKVLELGPDGAHPILADDEAQMHDGCLADNDELLLTDAANGLLVSLNLRTRECRSMTIAAPDEWFVRGIGLVDGRAYVLSSEVMGSRQRDAERDADLPAVMGSSFMISIVDLAAWAPISDRVLRLSEIARGSVAYSLLGWKS
jgi:hypothetical protein